MRLPFFFTIAWGLWFVVRNRFITEIDHLRCISPEIDHLAMHLTSTIPQHRQYFFHTSTVFKNELTFYAGGCSPYTSNSRLAKYVIWTSLFKPFYFSCSFSRLTSLLVPFFSFVFNFSPHSSAFQTKSSHTQDEGDNNSLLKTFSIMNINVHLWGLPNQ